LGPVGIVFGAEQTRQRRFLIPHDEGVRGEEKHARVGRQPDRPIEERGAAEGQDRSEIHGIADVPIWTVNYKATGRIERGGSPPTGHDERRDAPQRDRRARACHDETGVLHDAEVGRLKDPGLFQNPPWHEHKQ
jgi:hypothetical protein